MNRPRNPVPGGGDVNLHSGGLLASSHASKAVQGLCRRILRRRWLRQDHNFVLTVSRHLLKLKIDERNRRIKLAEKFQQPQFQAAYYAHEDR